MLKTAILIILSFFAVVGFIECILCLLETVSVSKYSSIKNVSITVELSGNISNVTFLLNTLLLQAERISYKNAVTKVIIKDVGLSEATYLEVYRFCMENDNIIVEK